jgi:hypothetical protein
MATEHREVSAGQEQPRKAEFERWTHWFADELEAHVDDDDLREQVEAMLRRYRARFPA